MSPSLLQVLESLKAKENLEHFVNILSNFNSTIHVVRNQIDIFFNTHNFFPENVVKS